MIKAKKSLGQNFLIDKNIIKKILNYLKIKNNNIVEIGPGTGNLTTEILNRNPKSLLLIEKDNNLSKSLQNLYGNKTKIINKDILNINLEKEIKDNSIIVGNLPYNIASQILIKLIKFKSWPPKYNRLIFMFQKEVANRILGQAKSSNYSRLTVISKWRLKVLDSFDVSNNSFKPKPKIKSTVIIFRPIINKKYSIKSLETLEMITQTFFSNKRKMINKNLNKIFKNQRNISKLLNIKTSIRPDQVSEDQYYKITELYEKL